MRVINPAIGRRLAAIRRHRMWSLAKSADAIGVTKGTIITMSRVAPRSSCRVLSRSPSPCAVGSMICSLARMRHRRGSLGGSDALHPTPAVTKREYSIRLLRHQGAIQPTSNGEPTLHNGAWCLGNGRVGLWGVLGDGVSGRYG